MTCETCGCELTKMHWKCLCGTVQAIPIPPSPEELLLAMALEDDAAEQVEKLRYVLALEAE